MTTALEIFHRLIDDPDYQAKDGKTREEVVWDEAKQRERQSRNNNRALSLAWTDSPSMKSFIEYLEKADEGEETDEDKKQSLPDVGAGHYKSETPLSKLLEAIRLHKAAKDGLPITGRNIIGSLRILAGPHLDAIGWLARNNEMKTPTNQSLIGKRKDLQRKYTPETELDEDTLSGDYNHEILSRMAGEYSDIERDYREVTEMLNSNKVFPLEHSKYTRGRNAFKALGNYGRIDYLRQKSDELNAARLPLLEDILAYLPKVNELSDPSGDDGYISRLPEDKQKAGMYGQQWVPSKLLSGSTRSLDNFPFGDENAVQKLVDERVISQEEANGLMNLEDHNDIALSQHINKFGPNLPINVQLDPQRANLQIERSNVNQDQTEAAQSFDRLTKNHPNPAMGRRNLYKLLDKAVKQPNQGAVTEGFINLPQEAGEMLDRLSPAMRTKFLDILVGELDGDSKFNMATMLNPDNEGKSPIMSVLADFAAVQEDETLENADRRKQKAFSRIQKREDTKLTPDQWEVLKGANGLDSLIKDLGTRINPDRLGGPQMPIMDDEWWKNTYNDEHQTYPFSPLGQPVPGIKMASDDSEPREGEEPTNAQSLSALRKRVYGDAVYDDNGERISGNIGEKETLEKKLAEIRAEDVKTGTAEKKKIEDSFKRRWGQYEADHKAFKATLRNEISELEQDNEPLQVSNPDSESASGRLEDGAFQFLEDRNITPSEEEVKKLRANEDFQRRVLGGLLTDIPETIEEGQAEFEERQQKNVEQIEQLNRLLSNDAVNRTGEKHRKAYLNALDRRNERINKWEYFLQSTGMEEDDVQEELDRLDAETRAEERRLSTDIFKDERTEHFQDIIEHAKNNGVTLRTAADMLNHVLNPLELEFLNSIDNEARLVHNISLGGDIANGLHNLEIPTDNPSLVIHTEGHHSDDEIRDAIADSEVYRALQNLGVQIQINPRIGGILEPILNKIDLYNPDNAWRNINPYNATQVAYPNTRGANLLPNSIIQLMGKGNIGTEFSFPRMWEDGFDKISIADKERLYGIIGGERPSYDKTIDEGPGYHLRDANHSDALKARDKVGKEHHDWVVERLEHGGARANKNDPTKKRRKVYGKEDLMAALQQKFDPEGKQEEGYFDPTRLSVMAVDDLTPEEKKIKNAFVKVNPDHKGSKIEGVLDVNAEGHLTRKEPATFDLIGEDVEEASTLAKNNRKERVNAVRNWATNVLHKKHFNTTIHPLQGSLQPDDTGSNWEYGESLRVRGSKDVQGQSIHDLLRLIPLNDHRFIFGHFNERDDDVLIGQASEPQITYKETSEGEQLVHLQKHTYDEEGKRVKDKYVDIDMEVEQELPDTYRDRYDAPVVTVQNPETYKGEWRSTDDSLEQLFNTKYGNKERYDLLEAGRDAPLVATRINADGQLEYYEYEKDGDTGRKIHDVKLLKTQSISNFGVGFDPSMSEQGVGRLEQYLSNVLAGSLDSKANLERDAKIREAALEREQKRIEEGIMGASASTSLAPKSGLPLTYINAFYDLMQKWRKIESPTKRHKVPDELLEDIKTNLPHFSLEGDSGRHSFLEPFLTNVYRQFSRWEDSQRESVLDEMDEDTIKEMGETIVQQVNDANKVSRDRKQALEARLLTVEGAEYDRIQTALNDWKDADYDDITGQALNTESNYYRNLPSGLQRRLERISNEVKADMVEGIQEGSIEAAGKDELDRMFHPGNEEGKGGGKEASILFTEDHINDPKGATHIPTDIRGNILTDQNGLALVESLPFEIAFPPERFTTRSTLTVDVGKLQDENAPKYELTVPSAYWWFRDPNIGPVLKAVADKQGKTLEDLLSNPSASIFNADGKIEIGLINAWLDTHGFLKGNAHQNRAFMGVGLPPSLLDNPAINLDDPLSSDPDRLAKIKNIRDILTEHKKALGGEVEITPKNVEVVPTVDHSVKHLSLNEVGRADTELQEILFNIFGGNPEGGLSIPSRRTAPPNYKYLTPQDYSGVMTPDDLSKQEPFLMGMLRSLGLKDDVFSPALTRDAETGESRFDLGTIIHETQNLQIVDIHKRLNDFLQFFEFESLPESTVYGERHAGGRKSFKVRNPKNLPSDWHLPENKESLELLIELRNALQQMTGDFSIKGDDPVFYVDPSYAKADKTTEVRDHASVTNFITTLQEAREQLAQEDTIGREKYEEQIRQLEAEKKYSLFNWLDSIYQGREILGNLAREQNIALDHMTGRDASTIAWDESDFRSTLESLAEQPLGKTPSVSDLLQYDQFTYFDGYGNEQELKPPNTHQDAANQHAILTQWLENNPENASYHTVNSYLYDLLKLMDTFSIPNILDINKIELGDGVEAYLNTKTGMFSNGKFLLWTPTGGINPHTKGLLNHFWGKRTGDDNWHFTSDMLPDYVDQSGEIPNPNDISTDSQNIIPFWGQGIQNGLLPALYRLSKKLPDGSMKTALSQIYKLDDSGQREINPNNGEYIIDHNIIRSIFGQYIGKRNVAGTDFDQLAHGNMEDKDRDEDTKLGVKHWLQDNWKDLFGEGIQPPTRYGRGNDYNWSQLLGIVSKINDYGESIIRGERDWGEAPADQIEQPIIEQEQPLSTEEQQDMALINSFIDKLANGDPTVTPALLRTMIEVAQASVPEDRVLSLDTEDYENIITSRQQGGHPPIPYSEWEQFPNFADHYGTLDDEQKALYNPPPPDEEEDGDGPDEEEGGDGDERGPSRGSTSIGTDMGNGGTEQISVDLPPQPGAGPLDSLFRLDSEEHDEGKRLLQKYREAIHKYNEKTDDDGNPIGIASGTHDNLRGVARRAAEAFDNWNGTLADKIVLPTSGDSEAANMVDYARPAKDGTFIPSWLRPAEEIDTEEGQPIDEVGMQIGIDWDDSNNDKIAWLNEAGWKPTLDASQASNFNKLFFGINHTGDQDGPQFSLYNAPTDGEIADNNLVKLFDVSTKFGFPHTASSQPGASGQPNDDYLKLSEEFRQRQLEGYPDTGQEIYDGFQQYFRDFISLNMQRPEVRAWWDRLDDGIRADMLTQIDTEILNNDANGPRINYGHRRIDFSNILLNEIVASLLNDPEGGDVFIDLRGNAQDISTIINEVLGEGSEGDEGQNIFARPVPETHYKYRDVASGEEHDVNIGHITHPGMGALQGGFISPKALLEHGKLLSARYYHLLASLITPEIEGLENQFGPQGREELTIPVWNREQNTYVLEGTDDTPLTADDWATVKLLLSDPSTLSPGDDTNVVPGAGVLSRLTDFMPKRYDDQGRAVDVPDATPYTWEEQLTNIEDYIGALKKAYNHIAGIYPDHQVEDGQAIQNYTWDEQIGMPSVGRTAGSSGNTISQGVAQHLADLGIIERAKYSGTGQRPSVPLSDMRTTTNPQGIFTDDLFTDGKLNRSTNLDKEKIGNWIKDLYTNREEFDLTFDEDMYQNHYGEPERIEGTEETPTRPLTDDEIFTLAGLGYKVGGVNEDGTPKDASDLAYHDQDPNFFRDAITNATTRAAATAEGWEPSPPPQPIITGTGGTGDGTGAKVTGTGGADGEEEPSRRDQLIQAIRDIKGYEDFEPGLLDEKDIYNFYKPLAERKNQQIAAGVPKDEVRINGDRRKDIIDKINKNRGNLGLHELPIETLNNMDDKALDKHHADISEQVSKQEREARIKDANNFNVPPLKETDAQNRNSLLNNWRRLINHVEEYEKDYTDETKQIVEARKQEAFDALKAFVGPYEDVSEVLQADMAPFVKEGTTNLQEVDGRKYGSVEHINEEHEKAVASYNKHQAWADYLRGADGNIPEEVQHPNRGANTFLHQDENNVLTSYEMLEAGSRMTTPTGNFRGKGKGDLVFSNEDPAHQGGMFVRGGSYSQLSESDQPHPEGLHDVSPNFDNMLNAPKIFGLPEDVEDAYRALHEARVRGREVMRLLYGDETDRTLEDWGTVKMPRYRRMEDMRTDAWDEEYPGENPLAVLNEYKQEYDEALGALNQAVQDKQIHEDTFNTLNEYAGYDRMDVRNEFLQDHTPQGLPIDAEGNVQNAPQYIDSSGTTRNRVYHRATKMWYDPEMLDDLRNRGQGSIGTIISNPYDAPNISGLKKGDEWANADDADMYRMAIPAVNYTNFLNDDGSVNNTAHHGIIISPTGVHKVSNPNISQEIPSLDAEGRLINHPTSKDINGNDVQRPYTAEEISQSSFELSRLNSEMSNPDAYSDEQGNAKNMISVDEEGYFDGGWGEWWNATDKLSYLEMPGIRNIWGAKRWASFMGGKPADRIKPSDDFNVQTSAGRRVWDNLEGATPVNEPAPPSRAEQIRNKENPYTPPKLRPQNRLRAAFDRAQILLNELGLRDIEADGRSRLSATSQLNQWLQGLDKDTIQWENLKRLMREQGEESGIPKKEVEDWILAENAKRQMEGDPRAISAYKEGGAEYVRPEEQTIRTQPPPEDRQIIDPTQQQGGSVLYGPDGTPISPPDPNFDQPNKPIESV